MAVITCIDDLKAIYVKKTPKMFYDYAESGSYTEQTFRENVSDFAKIRLRQRVARDLTGRSTESTMIGEKVAMPVALSPVGSCGMQSPDGEIKAARAAAAFGVPFTLSTMSICSIEDVAAASPVPFWFQLYVMRDEDFVDSIIERARAAGRCAQLPVGRVGAARCLRRQRDTQPGGRGAPQRHTAGHPPGRKPHEPAAAGRQGRAARARLAHLR